MKTSARRGSKVLASLVGMSLVIAAGIPAFGLSDAAKIANQTVAPNSVVLGQLKIDGKGQALNTCTGTVIADGWILTAKHCVALDTSNLGTMLTKKPSVDQLIDPSSLDVFELDPTSPGATVDTTPIKVERIIADDAADVAMVKVRAADLKHTKPADVAASLPENGEAVKIVGAGPGTFEEVQDLPTFKYDEFRMDGLEQRPCVRPHMKLASLDNGASVVFGDSGGGVFDSQGRLIGVVTSHENTLYETAGGTAFSIQTRSQMAVPSTSFFSLLKEANVSGASELPESAPFKCLNDADTTAEAIAQATKSINIVKSTFSIDHVKAPIKIIKSGPVLHKALYQDPEVPAGIVIENCLEGFEYCFSYTRSTTKNIHRVLDMKTKFERGLSPQNPESFKWVDLSYSYAPDKNAVPSIEPTSVDPELVEPLPPLSDNDAEQLTPIELQPKGDRPPVEYIEPVWITPSTPVEPGVPGIVVPESVAPFVPAPVTPVVPVVPAPVTPVAPVVPEPVTPVAPVVPEPVTPVAPVVPGLNPLNPFVPEPVTPFVPEPVTPVDSDDPITPEPVDPIAPGSTGGFLEVVTSIITVVVQIVSSAFAFFANLFGR